MFTRYLYKPMRCTVETLPGFVCALGLAVPAVAYLQGLYAALALGVAALGLLALHCFASSRPWCVWPALAALALWLACAGLCPVLGLYVALSCALGAIVCTLAVYTQ